MSAPEVLPPLVGAHGEPIDARVGSIVRWTHPNCQTNGVVIALGETWANGNSAYVRWFDHSGSGFYPLNHTLLKLVSK